MSDFVPDVPLTWDKEGRPHSVAFDDKYFCKQNGYEETIHVSCQGNYLQERFAKLDPGQKGVFTIIETGFGTGLSFCCAWELWDRLAPSSWELHFISIELYPISVDDLSRALSLWPKLRIYQEQLAAQYKPRASGVDVLCFPDSRLRLSLVFEDVVTALKKIKEDNIASQGADAWFLNGFAPSKNPKMWSIEVFEGVKPLSRKGTTFSTFTVAGFVRRSLQEQGFILEKIKGYGEKKEALTGVFTGDKIFQKSLKVKSKV